jgi:chromosome segregation ATPase
MGTMRKDEKPLPLAVDVDAKKREASRGSPSKLAVGNAIVRPKTTESQTQPPKAGKTSNKGQYTLMPVSSVRSNHSKQESRSSVSSKGQGSASIPQSARRPSWSTSQSVTPRDTPRTSMHPSVRSSILDEVGGTLSATITELQELQVSWQQDRSQTLTPDLRHCPSPTGQQSIRSARSSQDHGYFSGMPPQSIGGPNVNGIISMPHSPLKPSPLAMGPETPTQNLQQAYNEQKKHSHAVLLENDAVKRRLEFMRDRMAEFEEEKATLSQAAKEAEENLQMILTRLGEAKVVEQAAHNEIQSAQSKLEEEKKKNSTLMMDLDTEKKKSDHLQGKLEEVNVQKVDMLERDLENRKDIIVTKKKLKKALDELNALKRGEQDLQSPVTEELERRLEETTRKNKVLETELRKLSAESDLPSTIAVLTFKLEDMQRELSERNDTIVSLQESSEQSAQRTVDAEIKKQETGEELQNLRGRVEALKAKLDATNSPIAGSSPAAVSLDLQPRWNQIQEELRTARIERDQFSALLHAELRRAAVEDHNREHPSAAVLKKRLDLADATEIVRKRAKAFLSSPTISVTSSSSSASREDLEREIDYYLNDIVLYKLDVKGYKKDLRRVKDQIRELGSINGSSAVASPI